MSFCMTPTPDRLQDRYPSRISDRPALLQRLDPVLYRSSESGQVASGQGSAGPLIAAQQKRYEREGFLLLPDFFSAEEIAACTQELDRLCQSEEVKRRQEAIVEPAGDDLRSLFAVHRISPFFKAVAADERLVQIAEQLLESPVYIHQSRINLKPGFTGKEFYWHSDFETWHVEDGMPHMRAVSFSLLLTPNFEYNGPLMLVPGSHTRFAACVGQTPENHYQVSLRRQEYGVPAPELLTQLVAEGGIETCTGAAGTLVVFDCNTMHGSASNISPLPRSNLFLVYNSLENRLQAPYCGLPPRPEYIATREQCEVVVPQTVEYSSP